MTQKAKALSAYLTQLGAEPFDWRANNCVHFAGRYVAMVEGGEPLSGIAMAPTLAGTRRLIKRHGGLAAAVTKRLGREPIPPAFAQVGDVVLIPLSTTDPEALALGLCCGDCAAVMTLAGSVERVAMSTALHAWRVGP